MRLLDERLYPPFPDHTICRVAPGQFVPVAALTDANVALAPEARNPGPLVAIGTAPACMDKYNGSVWGLTAQRLIDNVHYLSAAAVSFARGLNDGPKIVGLLLVMKALNLQISMLAVAVAMAVGGWLNAHKVAVTMSKKISRMNDGQALTANLVTAVMVIFASRLGMPLSTTHVSVGSITGIGIVNGSVDKAVISSILMSWLLTLPIAAVISASAYWLYLRLLQ
jgi:PiT family inorganic phosphate transporter